MSWFSDLSSDLKRAVATRDPLSLVRSTAYWALILHIMVLITVVLFFPQMDRRDMVRKHERWQFDLENSERADRGEPIKPRFSFWKGIRVLAEGGQGKPLTTEDLRKMEPELPTPSLLFDTVSYPWLLLILLVGDGLFLFVFRRSELEAIVLGFSESLQQKGRTLKRVLLSEEELKELDREEERKKALEEERERAAKEERERAAEEPYRKEIREYEYRRKRAELNAETKVQEARAREAEAKFRPTPNKKPMAAEPKLSRTERELAAFDKYRKTCDRIDGLDTSEETKERLIETAKEELERELRRIHVD